MRETIHLHPFLFPCFLYPSIVVSLRQRSALKNLRIKCKEGNLSEKKEAGKNGADILPMLKKLLVSKKIIV